jgi:CheY-like chemotaxis protein
MAFVLVVDDDPLFREIVTEMLVQAGHAVASSDDGARALEAAKDRAPALAIVDMLMPERDGIETIADLRGRWPQIKVLAVSAGARLLDADLLLRAARTLGADATLRKPVEREALLAAVKTLLG